MSYNIPKTLLGSDSSGKLSFSTDGSKYALNSGEGFIGYKSNLGTYYQNAFVVDTNSTTPVVFSTNSTPAFSVSANASLVLFGNVLKGSLNVGDTNVPDFGNYYVPLGDAYFTSLIIGAGQKGGTLARTVSHELELRAGTSAQAFQIYNTYTDASNYERLEIKWDTNIATIQPTAAGTGTVRNLRLGDSSTYLESRPASNQVAVRAGGNTSFICLSTQTQFYRTILPNNDGTADLGTSAKRWGDTYTDALTVGDGVDAIIATSKQLKVDVDVSRLIADPDGPGISSFVQLTGDSQWANNTFGHHFVTELASNSQGPSNQVTGTHNSLIFRDSGHTGTSFWGATNNVTAMAPVNFGGRTVHALNNRFSNSHFISVNSGTEIAGMNCSQSWTYDPTVTGSPTLAGAVFNLTTGRLESAGYTHLRVNDASSPTSGSAGPQFLYGLYIEEQTQAQNAEDNFTILTEGGRSSIKELDTDVFRIYNTFTDFSNYEALEMKFDTNVATIATTSAGTGTGRLLKIQGEANVEIFSGVARLMRFTYNEASFHRTRLRPEIDGNSDLGSSTIRWGDTYTDTITIGDGVDAILTADADNELALRNGTNNQKFNLYATYTDASNYERLEIDSSSGFNFNTESVGTGSNQNLSFSRAGSLKYVIGGTFNQFYAEIRPSMTNLYSCGTNALRWSNVYSVDGDFSGEITIDTGIINTGSANAIFLQVGAQQPLVVRNDDSSFRGNVLPKFSGYYDLGSDTRKWQELHCNDASFSGDLVTEAGGNQYIYNTYTDASNYERLEIGWDSNIATISTAADGTGVQRTLRLGDNTNAAKTYIDVTTNQAGIRFYDNHTWILDITDSHVRSYRTIMPGIDSTYNLGTTSLRWANTYTDKITIGDGTDAILNGDGDGKIYMGNDSSQLTQFAVRGEDDGAGNYNQLEMRMATNGSCGLYSTGYGTQTPSGIKIFHNGVAAAEFTSTQIYLNKPFRPTTAGSEPIGTSSIPFGNIYINSSSKIYFNNAQLLGAVGGSGIILEQRNGTTEQRYYLYNTYTDASNYERLQIGWDSNVATIQTDQDGTGSRRELHFDADKTQISSYQTSGLLRIFWRTNERYRFENDNFRPTISASLGTDALRWGTTYTKGIVTDVETFTATDTLDDKNQVCLCNATTGNITLNLPVASSTPSGTQYQIKKIDSSSNTVIITPNSGAGDLIDGSATYTLSNQWEGAIIVCDGADWFITGGVTNSGGGGGGGGGLGGGD